MALRFGEIRLDRETRQLFRRSELELAPFDPHLERAEDRELQAARHAAPTVAPPG